MIPPPPDEERGGIGEEDMGEQEAALLEERIGGRGADLMEDEAERGSV